MMIQTCLTCASCQVNNDKGDLVIHCAKNLWDSFDIKTAGDLLFCLASAPECGEYKHERPTFTVIQMEDPQ